MQQRTNTQDTRRSRALVVAVAASSLIGVMALLLISVPSSRREESQPRNPQQQYPLTTAPAPAAPSDTTPFELHVAPVAGGVQPEQPSRALPASTETRTIEILREGIDPLLRHPEFLRRFNEAVRAASGDADSTITRELTLTLIHSGMPRLSLVELREWNRLRRELAAASVPACAAMWTGSGVDDYAEMFAQLSEPDLRSLTRLQLHAATLALEDRDRVSVGEHDLGEGFLAIGDRLPRRDRIFLGSALKAGPNLEPVAACRALQLTLSGAAAMRGAEQLRFLRVLASANEKKSRVSRQP